MSPALQSQLMRNFESKTWQKTLTEASLCSSRQSIWSHQAIDLKGIEAVRDAEVAN